jgi:hypothetical protein
MRLIWGFSLQIGLNAYLNSLKHIPTNVTTLKQLVAYNDAHKYLEEPEGYETQSL